MKRLIALSCLLVVCGTFMIGCEKPAETPPAAPAADAAAPASGDAAAPAAEKKEEAH